jgi:hypothetical protein
MIGAIIAFLEISSAWPVRMALRLWVDRLAYPIPTTGDRLLMAGYSPTQRQP